MVGDAMLKSSSLVLAVALGVAILFLTALLQMPLAQGSAVTGFASSAQAGWWIVLGSFSVQANAFQHVDDVAARCGLRAFHDLSNKFTGFTPGYNVVVSGPYGTRDEAEHALKGAKRCVPGAYLKYGEYAGDREQPQSPTPTSPASPPVSSEQDERQRAAEDARRRLHEQTAEDQLNSRLKELGFQRISPVDLNLDWRAFMTDNTKVAVRGTYFHAHDVEMLSTPITEISRRSAFTPMTPHERRESSCSNVATAISSIRCAR